MPDFCRELNTDIQVEGFVDGILCIQDGEEKREAINRITSAERNIKDYPMYPTLTHRDNRDYQYRDDRTRLTLRKRIIAELFDNKRLEDDDRISLGVGGATPITDTKYEGKAFYIIGPPAAGKSGVAAKIADTYGCYILDSDFAKRKLPEYTNQIGSASLVHDESDELVFGESGLMEHCLKKKTNIVIPKIGHNMSSILRFCESLHSAGYEVYLISVDLDRQKATQRAYNRFISTNRYVPLSLIFDGYGNQPTLNYFKIKQQNSSAFSGYSQISTDVPYGEPVKLVEAINMAELQAINWR